MNSTSIVNPLDYTDTFLREAIHLAYMGSCEKNRLPTLAEIAEYLPAHFRQQFSLHIITTEQFAIAGVEDGDELVERICDGEYDRFVPDEMALRIYLDEMNVSYLDAGGNRVRNQCAIGVW